MPKTIKNAFYKKITFKKFIEAHNRAKKGKTNKAEVILFEMNLESNILRLMKEIKDDTYKVGRYHSFKVYEPKERIIHALPYRDRIVHQWYVEEFIKPFIMPKFIYSTFACLPGKGTHKCASYFQNIMREYKKKHTDYYILKCDIKKYFYNIDANILLNIMKKYITDKRLYKFTEKLIMEQRPFDTDVGIPIGNYTSQFFANIYLNELDQYVKHKLHIHEYARYMDDFVFLCKDKNECIELKKKIEDFLDKNLKLELNHKSRYYPSKMGVNFCGYRIFEFYRLLRNSSKTKIKRNVSKWNKQNNKKELDIKNTMASLNSWKGHAKHCSSHRLQKKIIDKCDFLYTDASIQRIYDGLIEDMNNFS